MEKRDDTQIESAARVFEEIEKIRRGCDAKLTHMENNRRCLDCGKDWMPKKFEPCPVCLSKETKLMKKRRKCKACEHVWEPSELGVCPWCGSSSSESNPKDDPYMRQVAIPRLEVEETFHEKQLTAMVSAHPAWPWAAQVQGAGLTTVGRIIGKTDIHRVNTVSEMWSHCGWGLMMKCLSCDHIWTKGSICPECGAAIAQVTAIPQRKVAGMPLTYDPQLQSNCVILGESLVKAGVRKRCASCRKAYSSTTVRCAKCETIYKKKKKGDICPCGETKTKPGCPFCGTKETEDFAITPYGQYYLDQKALYAQLPQGHRHNRSFRHMIKLFLSHFWQTWREAEGLPAPAPYAFAILNHPEGHQIGPWEMVKPPAPPGPPSPGPAASDEFDEDD